MSNGAFITQKNTILFVPLLLFFVIFFASCEFGSIVKDTGEGVKEASKGVAIVKGANAFETLADAYLQSENNDKEKVQDLSKGIMSIPSETIRAGLISKALDTLLYLELVSALVVMGIVGFLLLVMWFVLKIIILIGRGWSVSKQ